MNRIELMDEIEGWSLGELASFISSLKTSILCMEIVDTIDKDSDEKDNFLSALAYLDLAKAGIKKASRGLQGEIK